MAKKQNEKTFQNEKSAGFVAKLGNRGLKSGAVICTMLREQADLNTIFEVCQHLFASDKCGQDRKSCQQQTAWYRSQLKRGLLLVTDDGVLVNLKSKKHVDHDRRGKNNLIVEVAEKKQTRKAGKSKKSAPIEETAEV